MSNVTQMRKRSGLMKLMELFQLLQGSPLCNLPACQVAYAWKFRYETNALKCYLQSSWLEVYELMWDIMDEELTGKCGRSQGMPQLFLWPTSEPIWSTFLWRSSATIIRISKKNFTDQESTVLSNRTNIKLFGLVHLYYLNQWHIFLESLKTWLVIKQWI